MKVIIILPSNQKEIEACFEFVGQSFLADSQNFHEALQGHNQAEDFGKHLAAENQLNLKLAQVVDSALQKILKDISKSDFGEGR